MTLLFILMFKKNVFGLAFHEIAGLAVLGMFVLHKVLNLKWIASVSKNLFNKDLSTRVKIGYLVDVLLLIAMTLIALSGFFISKIVFNINDDNHMWKAIHYMSSDIGLALVGIHVGLHYDLIVLTVKRVFKINKIPLYGRIMAGVIAALIMVFGIYNIGMGIKYNHFPSSLNIRNDKLEDKGDHNCDSCGKCNKSSQFEVGQKKNYNNDNFNRPHQGGNGKGSIFSNNIRGERSRGNALSVIANYASIIVAFAGITCLIEKVLKKHS